MNWGIIGWGIVAYVVLMVIFAPILGKYLKKVSDCYPVVEDPEKTPKVRDPSKPFTPNVEKLDER